MRPGNAACATHDVVHPRVPAARRHRPLCRDAARFDIAVRRSESAPQDSADQNTDWAPTSFHHETEESDAESGRESLH